jgi:Contractile injection system tube protein
VNDRIKEFMEAAYFYQSDIHEPYYLKVKWGLPEDFNCRLSSFDINYTSFDRDGTPLRAELKVSLISDEDLDRGFKKANPLSSDLTHSRMLRAGDTLPLLTRQIYGSSVYYLDVARFNNMDEFRNLTPGRQILFPPLQQLISGR